jgi:multidrug resistance efflux pump
MTDNNEPEAQEEKDPQDAQTSDGDPVRKWTIRILLLCVVLLAGYLTADRLTPVSSQARIHALVVPIAAEVSGTVTEVIVENNQQVQAGDVLFRLDDTNYQLAVAGAEANLQSARQATGASAASVEAARAGVASADAALTRAQQDTSRLRRIKEQDSGAISDRLLEASEASLIVAQQQLEAAKANLEQALQNFGSGGDDNFRIQQAQSALERALLDLKRTTVFAPAAGVVTDVRVNRGNFAAPGAPQMTFIATEDVWVQADFTENNLGHVDRGDAVRLAFDVFPGRVFEGTVRATGFGVAVDSAPLGSLPTIQNNRQWLRDAQRFPVIIDFDMSPDEMRKLKVGAQVTAMVYASDSWFFNTLGALYIRIGSILSYAY